MEWFYGTSLVVIAFLLFGCLNVLHKLNENFCKTARALVDGQKKIHDELVNIQQMDAANRQDPPQTPLGNLLGRR